jgi:ribonuclease inhibitor
MTRITIDGAAIRSTAALHAALRRELGLPDHTGANLDALWDAMTRDLAGPVMIEITGVAALRRRLGKAGGRVFDLLVEIAAERDDIALALLD